MLGAGAGMPLTPARKRVLRFVERYIEKHGYAPTLDEIAYGVGLSAIAGVHKHVTRLLADGYLFRAQCSRVRDLRVTGTCLTCGRKFA